MPSGIVLTQVLAHSPTFIAEWGSLIGVVVGVILGGILQMLNVLNQSQREQKRENRTRARDAYTDFLRALDGVRTALQLIDSALNHGSTMTERMDYFDRYVNSRHDLNTAYVLIQIHGSTEAHGLASEIERKVLEIQVGDKEPADHALRLNLDRLEKELIEAIRKDIGI